MKLFSIAVAAGLALAATTQASAVVVDFNSAVDSFTDTAPFAVQGFTFSTPDSGLIGIWNSTPYQADGTTPATFNGTGYLLAGYGNLVIEATDGSSFLLNGWDLALGWYQSVTPNTVTATFDLAGGGQAITRITLSSGDATGNTFASGYISLDNVNVSAVPEPASLALMLGGLALVGAAARRSGRST